MSLWTYCLNITHVLYCRTPDLQQLRVCILVGCMLYRQDRTKGRDKRNSRVRLTAYPHPPGCHCLSSRPAQGHALCIARSRPSNSRATSSRVTSSRPFRRTAISSSLQKVLGTTEMLMAGTIGAGTRAEGGEEGVEAETGTFTSAFTVGIVRADTGRTNLMHSKVMSNGVLMSMLSLLSTKFCKRNTFMVSSLARVSVDV